MKKNKMITLVDNGENVGFLDTNYARKMVDLKKAYYVDDKTICFGKKVIKTGKVLNKISIPKYSLSEELLSAISHGIGVLFSICITCLCIIYASIHHNVYGVVSSCIYGGTSIILYMMSTLYHSFKVNRAKKFFRIIDHCSIYLLIAGTYTPYALVTLREASLGLGWTVFGIIWACAILGIVFTAIDMNKFKKMGMVLYIVMGWMIVFTFKTLIASLDIKAIYFMLIAGIIYTIGAILYGLGKKIKYMHSIFHFFVVIASLFFFFSIFFYVI